MNTWEAQHYVFKLLNVTKAHDLVNHEGQKLHYNTSLLFCFLYLPLHGLLCNRFATFKHHMGTVHCKEFTEMTIIRKYTENHCMQKGCVHYICTGFSAKSTITCIASLIRFCGSKFPEQICCITHGHGTLKTTFISFSDSYFPLTFVPTECSSTGDSILQQIPNVMHRGEHSL